MPKDIRTIKVDGRKTTVRMERRIWNALQDVSKRLELKNEELFDEIEIWRKRYEPKLGRSSAIRVFVVDHLYKLLNDQEYQLNQAKRSVNQPCSDLVLTR